MRKFIDPQTLDFERVEDGLSVATVDDHICDMKVYQFEAGYTGPKHRHSDKNIKVLLSGELLINGESPMKEGTMYGCGSDDGDIYYVHAPTKSVLLVLQRHGTEKLVDD